MPSFVELKDDAKPSWMPRCRARKQDYADLRDPQPGDNPASGRLPAGQPAPAIDLLRRIASSDPDEAIELIYAEVDALLRADSFTHVDELLGTVDTSALSVVHLLAFVSITYAPRDCLSARAGFVARVRQRFAKVEPDRVEELLAGFE